MTRNLLALGVALMFCVPASAEMNFTKNSKKAQPAKVEEAAESESLKTATEDAIKEAVVDAKNEKADITPTVVVEEEMPPVITTPPTLTPTPPPVQTVVEEPSEKKSGFWGKKEEKKDKPTAPAKAAPVKTSSKKSERPDF